MDPNNESTAAGTTPAASEAAVVASADSTTTSGVVAGEGQGEAGKTTEGTEGTKLEGTEVVTGAPEKYEDFTLPEGYQLEGDRLEAVQEFAKTNNWTQEQAQQGVERYVQLRGAEMQHTRGEWGVQSETEFGKDFEAISGGAQRALVVAESLRPGITERLDATSLGNHPDMLWVMNQLGTHLKPKPLVGMDNSASSAGSTPLESRMYPNMK